MPQADRQFEKDVWAFVKGLDSSARVLFDHIVTDRDTDTPRQVDAWVNAKFGGHIPISILVSCKHHRRKLNITHIDSFAAEVRATRASMGVIYSSSGFSEPAMKKAKAHGLACCRLFQNHQGDLPQSLVFWSYFCYSRPQFHILDSEIAMLRQNGFTTYGKLLSMRTSEQGLLIDEIADEVRKKEEQAVRQEQMIPSDWLAAYTVSPYDKPDFRFRVGLTGWWEIYRMRQESCLINGSYCYSNGSFRGNVCSPSIDTWSAHPGPGWQRVERSQLNEHPIGIVMSRGCPNVRASFEGAADKPLLPRTEVK